MWDLTVEIQEFQFDKHYDITSLLWRNVPTMHNWYQSRVSPEALARHREQSVGVAGWQGGHQTSRRACPVPGEVTWTRHVSSWCPPGVLVVVIILLTKQNKQWLTTRETPDRQTVITEKHSSVLTPSLSPCILPFNSLVIFSFPTF